jgi:antiviral helicase SKI2
LDASLHLTSLVSDENLFLMPEFRLRLNILRKLNYIDSDNAIRIKGRVAREINSSNDELVITELIFENVLTPLAPQEAVALLSCLIFEGSCDEPPRVNENLNKAIEQLTTITTQLANAQLEGGLDISPQDYINKTLKFGLVEVVHEWARGITFNEITNLTDVLEGNIVRCIVRLDEMCREIRSAARIIGDSRLFKKMEEASTMIKRDIIFASSLYIT